MVRAFVLVVALLGWGTAGAQSSPPPSSTWWMVTHTPQALWAANLGAAMRSNGLALVEEALYYRAPRQLKEGQADYLVIQTLYDCNLQGKFKTATMTGFKAGQALPSFHFNDEQARWRVAPKASNSEKQWLAVCKNGQGATAFKHQTTHDQVLEAFRKSPVR